MFVLKIVFLKNVSNYLLQRNVRMGHVAAPLCFKNSPFKAQKPPCIYLEGIKQEKNYENIGLKLFKSGWWRAG